MQNTGNLPENSGNRLYPIENQKLEGDNSTPQSPGTKAELTSSDGTKMKMNITTNPRERTGVGVRGSGFAPKVQDLIRSTTKSKIQFDAKNSDSRSPESDFAQSILKIGPEKEGSAKEILTEDASEILTDTAKEILTITAEERLDERR